MMKRIKNWILHVLYLLIGSLDDEKIPTEGLNYVRAVESIEAQTFSGKKAFFYILCDRLSQDELKTLKIAVDDRIREYPNTSKVGKENKASKRVRGNGNGPGKGYPKSTLNGS